MGPAPAHPRVCGENAYDFAFVKRTVGSSPRVRGKRCHVVDAEDQSRLIPACAGKTTPFDMKYSLIWAHPRVCGEN